LSFGTIVSSIPILLLITLVALPVTFIAMNPRGALDIVMTTGQFMIVAFMDIVKGGLAVLWWVMQAIGVNIGNFFIWIGNMLISLVNSLPNALNNVLPDWMKLDVELIPQIEYLKMPPIDPVVSNIINEIMDGYTNLRVKISDYWSTVQANAPMSYVAGGVAGAGSAGATYAVLAQEASTKAVSRTTRKKTTEKIDVTDSYALQKEYAKKGYKIVVDGKTGKTYAIKEAKTSTV